MALPYLVKHIYNSGTEEVIRRGKKIHALNNVELVEYDELMANVVFRVKDDGYSTFYKVHINQFKDPKTLSLRCSCPYNLSEICRHKAGALFHLQDLLDRNQLCEKDREHIFGILVVGLFADKYDIKASSWMPRFSTYLMDRWIELFSRCI